MGCRIGMATDVADRVRELKSQRLVPSHANYVVLASGLAYEDANHRERRERQACGPHCEGSPGGSYVSGNCWSVYRIIW